ncbi:hypothetical protein EJB05_07940 [Eragrostis curvula]|uniref:GRF-type domain-containing protein n=1 Tax=Eragrostis curvula TaxID=38414 RepID=A0A5J9WK94_9POAL|nr:hypothetical protein EJB05_07940 [Eragrostis curvula]
MPAQTSFAGSSRSGSLFPANGSLPVIECPKHPDRKLVLLTANTERNRGKKFYRCMKGYKTDDACHFFIWEDKYYEYLVDNGFLEDAFLETNTVRSEPVQAPVQASVATNLEMQLRQDVAELKATVRMLERNIAEMQSTINSLKSDKTLLYAMGLVLAAVLVAAMLK